MFETFDHTADLGLRARADDLDTLFTEAAHALLSAIVEDPSTVQAVEAVEIRLEEEELDYLLFDWLKTLLYHFEVDRRLLCHFEARVEDGTLRATARGEPWDPERHELSHEVKAITYHGLKVEQTEQGWLAEVIVDI